MTGAWFPDDCKEKKEEVEVRRRGVLCCSLTSAVQKRWHNGVSELYCGWHLPGIEPMAASQSLDLDRIGSQWPHFQVNDGDVGDSSE